LVKCHKLFDKNHFQEISFLFMFLALDVDYRGDVANAAGIVFSSCNDEKAISEYTAKLDNW